MTASTTSRTSRDTAIAGANDAPTADAPKIWRGLGFKFALLVAIMVTVPIITYIQVRDTELNKRELLLAGVIERGGLVARGIGVILRQNPDMPVAKVKAIVEAMAGLDHRVKLFFRPKERLAENAFFYITSIPAVANDYLERERDDLIGTGIFDSLRDICGNDEALALRYTNPGGHREVLTSVTSVESSRGCWAVVTSHISGELVGTWIDRPFWQSPEVRLAALLYAGMAIVVLGLFVAVWRGLERFARVARTIRRGIDVPVLFRSSNRIPELTYVAEEFDRMVDALRDSAQSIRDAAEENAHAFKTPIATIAQSIEPLRKCVGATDERARRALEVIESSLGRLDALVTSSRRMDETIAQLVDPPRETVNLSRLARSVVRGYAEAQVSLSVRIESRVEEGLFVVGGEDLLETVIENLMDNAVSFSPADARVVLTLRGRARDVELLVEDQGPGVAGTDLERIFKRYYSSRPVTRRDGGQAEASSLADESHFGVGLWIVHRNVRAIGGEVFAENRAEGGLRIVARLPRV